ncbi:MAG: AAA family ATPase [Ottowia sp.]|nr:AAA family ATPase [Ottowia sp.]
METHISRIFLVGDRALKMKRAVRLPYADFSTAEQRLQVCEKEVALNAPGAPGLYLGVRRITRAADGGLEWDGAGELVDAVVVMRRFDQDCLFSNLARAGALTLPLMTATAQAIARSHEAAPVRRGVGGAARMAAVLDINRAGFGASRVFTPAETKQLDASFRAALMQHAALLDRRATAGQVRRCHGDLHLRNICLINGQPRLFDCIEFSDEIATVDVLYDLAFLLMDLWHLQLVDLSNWVMNRYLDTTGDDGGFALLPFFMAVRAAVRAHVIAAQAGQGSVSESALAHEARGYYDLATSLLHERPACLIAIGGFSGSGKSTVSDALAAHVGAPPGARVIESDRVRKARYGVAPDTRLPPSAYRPEVSVAVYDDMAARAEGIVAAGGAAIVNAVFDRAHERARIQAVAARHGVPFLGLWLDAPPDVLQQRVAQRTGSASDATVDVLQGQLAQGGGVPPEWQRLDAARDRQRIVDDVLALLGD